MSASLAGLMFWLSVASCLVAEVAIIRATFSLSHGSPSDSSAVLPHPRRWLEIVWVVLPAIALIALFASTWGAIDARSAEVHVFPPAADTPRPLP